MLMKHVIVTVILFGPLPLDASVSFQRYAKLNTWDLRMEPLRDRVAGVSISKCGVDCEQTLNCVSFSFHSKLELCELNRYNPNDLLATHYSETGWEIYGKYDETCWPYGYDGFVRDGMCYFWAAGKATLTWEMGEIDCRDKGAELVCIESEAENQALVDHVPFWYWWFGLTLMI